MRFPYVEAIVRGSVASAFAVPLWPPFVATFPLLYYRKLAVLPGL